MPFDLTKPSVRRYDDDGRLHVNVSHISKACVNPYRGREIPDAEKLGLDPDGIYQLLRDPEELAKAAPTFNNLPVLRKHIPVSAQDSSKDDVVGSTGTDAVFRAPYLDNSLVFWDKEGIAGVESGMLRELSSAYHYRADMTPGVYQGTQYHGVMRDIRGNHVAQVESGRAGSDVIVMDSALKAVTLADKLADILKPKLISSVQRLAKDSQLGKFEMNKPKAKTSQQKENAKAVIQGIALGRKLAQDATIDGLVGLLNALEGPAGAPDAGAGRPEGGEVAPGNNPNEPVLGGDPLDTNAVAVAADPTDPDPDNDGIIENPDALTDPDLARDNDIEMKVRELLTGKLDDADLEMLLTLIRPDGEADPTDPDPDNDGEVENPDALDPPASVDPPSPFPKKKDDDDDAKDSLPNNLKKEVAVNKPAMDAAIKAASALAVKQAVAETTARMKEIKTAENAVRPWVGNLTVAMDSAADVYKFALEQNGVNVKGVHSSAFPALLNLIPKPGEEYQRRAAPRVAMDAKQEQGFYERFPNAKRMRVIG